jgi:uncharacterized protein (TIGR00661 family)
LNWGLGHASRVVPIIKLLLENNLNVIVASSGESEKYLQIEFPELRFIILPNYKIKYSRSNSQVLSMLGLSPRILYCSIIEHFRLKKIISQNNIDIVISDNRFGLWNSNVYSIFITHQLKVIFPRGLKAFEFIYQKILRCFIRHYDECWVPDYSGKANLAGDLAHKNNKLKSIKYIGALSRFSYAENIALHDEEFDMLFILSGPEPQRSLFEEIVYREIDSSSLKFAIVRGTSEKKVLKYPCPSINIASTNELYSLIKKSKLVVCRSGYSSVMDLVVMNKKAVLIPTPGQTEQEYLAKYLSEQGLFKSIKQREFSLEMIKIEELTNPNFEIESSDALLKEILRLKEKEY